MKTKVHFVLAGLLLMGCNNQDPGTATSSSEALTASDVAVARVTRFARNEAQVTDKLAKLVGAVGGASGMTPGMRSHQATVALPGRAMQARFDVDIGDDDRLKGIHESHDDSFEVFDNSIRPASATGADLTIEQATAAFEASYGQLVASGVVDPTRLRRADAITRIVHAAEGDQNGMRRSWINEHIFFVPLTIGGIRVGTTEGEYGLNIHVHRSGKIRRIALSGAGIAANEPGSVSLSQSVNRAERKTPAETTAVAQLGASEVHSLGLRYVVNEDATAADDLVARDLLLVSPTSTGPSGETVHGKAYLVSYAVNDPSDAVDISPKPGTLGPNAVLSK
jgi:hypothetical protein